MQNKSILFFHIVNFDGEELENFTKWCTYCTNSDTICVESLPSNNLSDIITFSELPTDFDIIDNNKKDWKFDNSYVLTAIPTNIGYNNLYDVSTLNKLVIAEGLHSKLFTTYYCEKLQQLFILMYQPTDNEITRVEEIIRIYTGLQ